MGGEIEGLNGKHEQWQGVSVNDPLRFDETCLYNVYAASNGPSIPYRDGEECLTEPRVTCPMENRLEMHNYY